MLLSIIELFYITGLEGAALVNIQLLKGFFDNLFSEWMHRTFDRDEELVNIKRTITILIESVEQVSALLLAELESEIAESLPELLDLESARVVVVKNLEHSLKSYDASGSSGSELGSELLNEFIISVFNSAITTVSVS